MALLLIGVKAKICTLTASALLTDQNISGMYVPSTALLRLDLV